ncbi:MAG: site-2 protease family protein [Anaerolineae bacterium]
MDSVGRAAADVYYPSYSAPAEDPLPRLRAAVEQVFAIETIQTGQVGVTGSGEKIVTFTGSLRQNADSAYRYLQSQFTPLGYTPMMRQEAGAEQVIAMRGVIPSTRSRLWINGLLFVATVASVLFVSQQLWSPLGSFVFTLALLSILGFHEFGHYLVAQIHGLKVTLPYFIPMPLPPLGTMGAFIRLKSPIDNRRALFDMAIAGPLAGFAVALPLFIVGLLLPQDWVAPLLARRMALPLQLSNSLLTLGLTWLLKPDVGVYELFRNPLTAAGWFGMLVTALNLLPAGQLDGGHISYAVFGRRSRIVAFVTLALLVVASRWWTGWLLWAGILLVTGLSHPMPLNDITTLNWPRKLLALAAAVLFIIVIAVQPFRM